MTRASTILLLACAFSAVASASLDKDLVRGRIRAKMVKFRACYERALEKNPTLEGKVIAKFVVGMDGRVTESTAEGLPGVDACVAAVIKTIRFPPNGKGTILVNYPFLFAPDRR